ncbi:MAG: hypothetical protein Fur0036_17140 [Fimbriimonadaceae bacterium]
MSTTVMTQTLSRDDWREICLVLREWARVDQDPGQQYAPRPSQIQTSRRFRQDPQILHFRLVEDFLGPHASRALRMHLRTVSRLGELACSLPVPETVAAQRDRVILGIAEANQETRRVERTRAV